MKKLLLSVCAGVASVCAYAQPTSLPQMTNFDGPVQTDNRGVMPGQFGKTTNAGQRYTRGMWYNFAEWMRAQGQTLSATSMTVFGDSTVKTLFVDQQNNVTEAWNTWLSVGAVFDPKDDIFGDSAFKSFNNVNYQRFTLDSVGLVYAYIRNVEEYFDSTTQTLKPVVDTLVVSYVTGSAISPYTWTASGEVFGTIPWNRNRRLPVVPAAQEMRIPLTIDDTSAVLWRARAFATNKINVPAPLGNKAGGLVAAAFTFKSGVPYNFGDTLTFPSDSTIVPAPKKKLNQFFVRTWVDQNKIPLAYYNNGLLLHRNIHNRNALGDQYGSKYLASSAFENRFYSDVSFHITSPNVGVAENEMKNGYGAGNVYPNPASGNATFEFALGNTENVKVQLINMVGQPVATLANGTYAAGKHTINFSTQDLKAGMYFYTITAGDFVKTVRFSVAQ